MIGLERRTNIFRAFAASRQIFFQRLYTLAINKRMYWFHDSVIGIDSHPSLSQIFAKSFILSFLEIGIACPKILMP